MIWKHCEIEVFKREPVFYVFAGFDISDRTSGQIQPQEDASFLELDSILYTAKAHSLPCSIITERETFKSTKLQYSTRITELLGTMTRNSGL